LDRLAPSTVFAGKYRVVRALNEGGMGAVYVAEQLSTSLPRALKLMHPHLLKAPGLLQRFEREAKVGARIESEHVVQVIDAGVDEERGYPWLAMELLKGRDLSQRITGGGALSPTETRQVMEQVFHAVSAAHRAGIVHRDLKPENIFLAELNRVGVAFTVKVLDFGIAKILADVKSSSTDAVGSPIWMAPEQSTANGNIGPHTDVWAIGLIAFHLLTGRYYWPAAENDDASLATLLREIVLEPLPLASARARDCGAVLPPSFDAWFARCVAREPAERFSDATEAGAAFASMIRALEDPQPAPATEPVAALATAPLVEAIDLVEAPPPAPVRRVGPGIAAAAILGVIFAGTLVVWLVTNGTAGSKENDAPVRQAIATCETGGDCERSHELISGLSPETRSQFPNAQKAEDRWATQMLERANREKDTTIKRNLFYQVEQATEVSAALREKASTHLAALEPDDAKRGALGDAGAKPHPVKH